MRNILWVLLFTTLSTTVAASNSDYDVEEIIVVGAYIVEGRADAEYDDNLLESIMPTKSYVAGGPGGGWRDVGHARLPRLWSRIPLGLGRALVSTRATLGRRTSRQRRSPVPPHCTDEIR